MKILHILLIVLVVCAGGLLVFAGINNSGDDIPPEEVDPPEDEWPYPISFLKIDAVQTPDPTYTIIPVTDSDKTKYPVLIAALENGETYLNIHPDGPMSAEEYYAIQDTFGWGHYASYNGTLYLILIGAIGIAPPLP